MNHALLQCPLGWLYVSQSCTWISMSLALLHLLREEVLLHRQHDRLRSLD